MRCDEVRAWISEYIDGVFPAGDAHDLDRHIDSCPDCAAEYKSVRQAVELVRRCETVAPPEEFRRAWRARLAEAASVARSACEDVVDHGGTGAGNILQTQPYGAERPACDTIAPGKAALRASGQRENLVQDGAEMARRGLPRWPGLRGAFAEIKRLASRRVSVSVGGLAAAALVAVLVLGTLQASDWLVTSRQGGLLTKVAPPFEGATGRSLESGMLDEGAVGDVAADMAADAAAGGTAALAMGGLAAAGTKALSSAPAVQEQAGYMAAVQRPAARKVILDASLRLRVKSYKDAAEKLEEISRKAGGYVESSLGEATAGELRSGTMSLRIPQDAFDAVMKEVEAVGKVVYKDVSARDITEEYVDLEKRLGNARRQEAKLLELLNRANSVEDALAVERELGRVREQVELLTGKLNFLEHTVSFSSIRVRLEEPSVASPWPPGLGFGDVFARAARAFIDTVAAMIVAVGRLLPVALLVGVSIPVYVRLRRRRSS